ncbi:glycoside hydrolase family 19 protein [Pseudoflavitalea sp. G-6-1-2]|uniref:glycoside hydrolase family 19 protein n=1 Tax=Pseudoflavitalea sp. G-6-1-2 TaxID=2728841 RepID=UPI00146D9BD2|nr:glycoside hydrolase family 19 protein [Pseudoflavitalea sp. G-6-1-2]NML23878.1 glycoside hydrolase family 19 protein [Pseudoflavitalea sp. G-6-1-2]
MNTPLISAIALKHICWKSNCPDAGEISELINKVCPLYGISTLILHEFLANVLHESNEFRQYEEDLHYSAQRLMQVWPLRFKTIQEALPFAHNPQKLACKVYNGRMGNTEPLDGWEYRGSGPIQMTGKSNFTLFASWMDRKFNISKPVHQWARSIRTDTETGMHAACWIFSISKGLNDEALRDEMKRIIEKINGGWNGLQDRLKYYELCKRYLA